MDFDYKKYSLENLEKWMSDALTSSEATPQEIYDVIHKVVEEEYHYFKHHTGRCYDLLTLLNGNGKGHLTCDKDDPSEECKGAWNDFWEENYYPEEYEKSKEPTVEDIMPPWGHSDMEALRYTEEELNAMCEKAASDQEKEKCREYNLREAEYYDKRAQLDGKFTCKSSKDKKEVYTSNLSTSSDKKVKIDTTYGTVSDYQPKTYDEMIADGYWMTDDGFWMPPGTKDKVKKWILPVEETKIAETDETEYFVSFPDDLLEAADLKEGDQVEWVDKGNGTWMIRKVTKPIKMEEC
jgi:hypothetical protein